MSKVKQGQTFLDKVVHLTGSWENVLDVAIKNNLSITSDLDKGSELIIPEELQKNNVVSFFKRNDEPATKLSELEKVDLEDKGIGKMIIESSFIIR